MPRELLLVLAFILAPAAPALAAQVPDAAVREEDGKYFDKAGNPTYKIGPGGEVGWYTYSGYRRFNGACEVCHGFGGGGSTFAPDLTESLKTLSYDEFRQVVVGGRQRTISGQTSVMPAFGTNPNVMCYLDDIYVYLRARAAGEVGTGRPAKHEEKPEAAKKYEEECMG